MADPIRIANCSGFYGDRRSAALEMVEGGPIDVLTGDWLAELTMLILAKDKARNPDGGFAKTFVAQMADVLAASEGHEPDAPWGLVPEEQLTHITTWAGKPANELIRADLTFFETPNNGAVFSTGSITFCGSLLHNDGDNNVSRLIRNVLDRFLDPNAKFPMPEM